MGPNPKALFGCPMGPMSTIPVCDRADRGGLLYGVDATKFDKDGITLCLGFGAKLDSNWEIDFDYRAPTSLDGDATDQPVTIKVGKGSRASLPQPRTARS